MFHKNWKAKPLWWDTVSLEPAEDILPSKSDVVVVGSGYTGLSAALTLTRAGLSVAVLDRGDPGHAASTRNHGMVSGGQKLPKDIDERFGYETARMMEEDAKSSFEFLENLISSEKLDVDYARDGRFNAAHTHRAFEILEKRAKQLGDIYGYRTEMVPREAQRTEIGSDYYVGGMLLHDAGGLNPAKLHRALRSRAVEAGAKVLGQARVQSVKPSGGRHIVNTSRGTVRADQVIFATNAYTDRAGDYLMRRVVPVYAYMLATEELDERVVLECNPSNRMIQDSKRSLWATRRTPDGKRITFSGRAKFGDTDERTATPILRRFMLQVYPQLQDAKIEYTWKGLVGFTFDWVPHIATHEGIHYVGGCQGNGVAMMPYLGYRTALKILKKDNRACAFDRDEFPTIPCYSGKPWFLPAMGAYYKARDGIDRLIDWG